MLRISALFPVVVGLLAAFSIDGEKLAVLTNHIFSKKIADADKPPYAVLATREHILINEGWKFFRYDSPEKADSLIYDVRPEVRNEQDSKAADSRPTEAVAVTANRTVLKPWILPTGNAFLKDPAKRHARPAGNPGGNFPFVQTQFNDQAWESVDLPHDWAIKGPFYVGEGVPIGGGMGRLPVQGVAWYRKKLQIPASDAGRTIYLDVDGAMSYAMVWMNGKLVGGWPYGYSSWRLDLTPYLIPGADNQLAIRLDNPPGSARWYPGGGIYRNVWLTKVNPVHVGQWGTVVKTRNVSKAAATIDLRVSVANKATSSASVDVATEIYALNANGEKTGRSLAKLAPTKATIRAQSADTVSGSVVITNPKLWGPPPTQTHNRYVAVTTVSAQGKTLDTYQTTFGIREVRFDPDKGLFVNGEHIVIKGVNQHHDLGALGAAFNVRAAERQLQLLREMGCNAIRMSHNPPAPELLELTDRLGFLVIDEVFDSWETKKTPLDFHLIFPDWHEQDLRALVRRDRNSPSVILWSFGNEVGEQYTGERGAAVARELHAIVKEEDPTRPTTVAMNYAKPDMPLPAVVDVISLNYQGEGIRYDGAYKGLKGITTPPLFPEFHKKFPGKMILSSENASALSSRGEYLLPVFNGNSAPVLDGQGGDPTTHQVSAYELYSVAFGSSADKVFATMAQHPYVAGGFVWTGWDYLGEPTPYYSSRSSYSGIIDLAGFKKDRFYLYQAYWRPEVPMAHLLPHWNWPQRLGQVVPVHVFTSGDEAELFLNGKSLGRKKKAAGEYRVRWDDVVYAPGELKVVAYKNGKRWAEDVVKTTGEAASLKLTADRATMDATGTGLIFVTAQLTDKNGLPVSNAKNKIQFFIEGPGEIVATDNGDAANIESFASPEREAFNGKCLVIVRGKKGQAGTIRLKAQASGLESATISLKSK
ncbi:beta-galactosidase GalB [Hymenobacter sp. GOD-10R]|uniref:beta-galactosidase GalB n=1 Tax=Hymenobacter sp. GOD-10R TaxID=3093922 RepID=UPI002D76D8A3|nr:beta-galactosidase GalB [Hymenobacter sp. GOD-10R]WRQ30054.1 beta-galactosidase GalB [Hymenobacter sp. GOD-10R]